MTAAKKPAKKAAPAKKVAKRHEQERRYEVLDTPLRSTRYPTLGMGFSKA